MSVKVMGKKELLAGQYQDIIISENKQGNFYIKARPHKLFKVNELDESYKHIKLEGTDIEKINQVMDYYMNNNTIFMITQNGRLKNYSGESVGINAYYSYIDGYIDAAPALYLKVRNKLIEKKYIELINKYKEDRIRHLNKILNCKKIYVKLDLRTSSYYINGDKAYVHLLSRIKENNFELECLPSESAFLEQLLFEFLKQNKVTGNNMWYPNNMIEIHSDDYKKTMELADDLYKYIIDAKNEYYRYCQELENITIDEYIKEKEKTLNLIKK